MKNYTLTEGFVARSSKLKYVLLLESFAAHKYYYVINTHLYAKYSATNIIEKNEEKDKYIVCKYSKSFVFFIRIYLQLGVIPIIFHPV